MHQPIDLRLSTLCTLVLLAAPAASQGQGDTRHADAEGGATPLTECYEALRPVRAVGPVLGLEGPARTPSASFLTVNQDPEGDMPRDVVFSADGSETVIVNRDTDTVTFFDVATRTITHTVTVGDFPVDVEVTPDGLYAVVPNVFGDSVSVLSMATHSVVATVPITGSQPYRVAVTSDSAYAVVGVINDAVTSAISVIDLGTLSEIRSFATTPQGVFGGFFTPESGIFGNLFTSFALSPDDATLVLPDRYNDQVAIYDVTTGSQVALLPTSQYPTGVDISYDGLVAVVALTGSGDQVATIDLTVPAITNSYATGSNVYLGDIRITPDKSYALQAVMNALDFVDLATGAVTSTVSTGTVGDIEISYDGQYALVSNYNTRVINIASQSLVRTITYASCYDAAASPVEHRFVALNNRFREDIHLYSTNGALGFFEGAALSGEVEEGDAPRTLAITPDGLGAVVACNTSDNAVLVDLVTGTVSGYVPTGQRSLGVAVSPDGTTALVVNGTSNTTTAIDLLTGTVVATLSTPSTPAEVVISPDSQSAYVTSLAGTDRLYFIDLAGAASSVTGSLITGQMGSIGYSYGVMSGMSISPDGTTLALCISFDDELLLVDTATKTEIARVPVGDFPIRATFSADSGKVYVTHSFGDSLSEVTLGGGTPTVTGTATNIEFPLHVTLDADGSHAYVGSWDFSNPTLDVVDTATMSTVATVALTSRPRDQQRMAGDLFVSLTDGDLARVDLAGTASTVIESVALSGSPSAMAFSPALGQAVCAQPGVDDGVDLVQFGGDATNYCGPAVPNSSGQPAVIAASGTFLAGGYPLRLDATDLPTNQFGYFLASQTQGFVAQPGGSQGNLCLGGTIARFVAQVQSSGPGGAFGIDVDTLNVPLSPPGPILSGETWNFQAWFRDVNPTNTSNFTDGVSVLFE